MLRGIVAISFGLLLAGGASAHAAGTVTITPKIKGEGRIDATWEDPGTGSCLTAANLNNQTVTQCPTFSAQANNGNFKFMKLTATPAAGWRFVSWQQCQNVMATFANPCSILYTDSSFSWEPVVTFVEIVPVTFTSKPPAFTNNKRTSVSFTSPGTTFTCQVDTGAAAACTSPFTLGADLADGPHTITVIGNHNGDPSVDPAVASFTVDTVAPTATLDPTSGPGQGALQAVNAETFRFTSSEAGTFQCSLDSGAFSGCASPFTVSRLTAGAHTFNVRAVDQAGNTSAPVSRSWSVAASDDDDDGFNARVDCNDANPSIHPGATEVPDDGIDQNCDGADDHIPTVPAAKPAQIPFTVSFFAKASAKSTKFSRLQLKGVPAGATVKVTCAGRGCPKGLTGKGFSAKPKAGKTISLAAFIKKAIPVTAKITVTVAKPGSLTTIKTITLRKAKSPTVATKCREAAC